MGPPPVSVSTGRLPLLVPNTETPPSLVLLVALVLESVLDIGLILLEQILQVIEFAKDE
jgi:hypothetical protein